MSLTLGSVAAGPARSITTTRWLGTQDTSSPETRLLDSKRIVYSDDAQAWLDAHKGELAEPKAAPTERLPKLTEAPSCPYCDALGTLKRVRRGLKVCSACHVAMPWRRPRVARPDFITRLSWKIEPDQHGDGGLDERPPVSTRDLERPATRKNDIALSLVEDAPKEDAAVYEAPTYKDERKQLEATYEWLMEGRTDDDEPRMERLHRMAIKAGRFDLVIEADRLHLFLGGDELDLTVKTVRTAAERRRGLKLPSANEPPLLVIQSHETAARMRGVYWRQQTYRLAQRALAAIAEKIGRPAPLPLEEAEGPLILGDIVCPVGLRRSTEITVSTRDSARYHRRWSRNRLTISRREWSETQWHAVNRLRNGSPALCADLLAEMRTSETPRK